MRAINSVVLLVFLFAGTSFADEVLKDTVLQVPKKYRKDMFGQERLLKAPDGIKVSVFASGLEGPRMMAFDKRGNLYVTMPREGQIAVLPDEDKDGVADSFKIFADGLDRPHGLAFVDGELIAAETGALIALRDENDDLKADTKRTLTKEIPAGGGHWTRTILRGPDGLLYISAGSSCNACVEKDKRRAAVMRLEDGKVNVFATGLRNSVGIAFHPETKELWGVDNGRDMLGDDMPPEELNRIVKGGDYGWPYCYGDRVPDQELGSIERCENTMTPAVKMQAHSAPLGLSFGHGLKFPGRFRDALFIGFHGSWNRSIPTGYKLVAVPFKDGMPVGQPFDFITGWLEKDGPWGRPVQPAVGSDGALYLTDDHAGAIYRITAE